jgi:hypothetical protein
MHVLFKVRRTDANVPTSVVREGDSCNSRNKVTAPHCIKALKAARFTHIHYTVSMQRSAEGRKGKERPFLNYVSHVPVCFNFTQFRFCSLISSSYSLCPFSSAA